MLLELELVDEKGTQKNIETQIENIAMKVKQSIDQKTLKFERDEVQGEDSTLNLSTQTGEKLVDWARKKAKKGPYGMLELLSARVKEFSFSTWVADVETSPLAIANLK